MVESDIEDSSPKTKVETSFTYTMPSKLEVNAYDNDSLSLDDDRDDAVEHHSLDQCIDASREQDMFSIAKHNRGHKQKRRETSDNKPIAFIRFNTRLGKAKPVTLRALLDSGGSESLITAQHVSKLRVKSTPGEKQVWSTPGGTLTTNKKVRGQFTIPELQEQKLIEWDLHVTDSLGAYDVILAGERSHAILRD